MATGLETQRRKALKGVIREINSNHTFSLISAEVKSKNMLVVSEIPKKELQSLKLKIGDAVDIFPIDSNTYLIVNQPK